ncbi:tetratricopeptide repeat protein [bacterium]|nr:tetratricopeptide repeat protein [bacterium]
MKKVLHTTVLFLSVFTMGVVSGGFLLAQDHVTKHYDSLALENVSSEDLLKLKEDIEGQKSKLETERLQLLDKGLKQSKEYLEKVSVSSTSTALVLLQRAEYLLYSLNDNFQTIVDSISIENAKRLGEWDRMREEKRQQWIAQGKKDKELEELLDGIEPPNQFPEPEMDYSDVSKTYQKLIESYPESQYVVDAMYNIAYIREQEGNQLRSRALTFPEQETRWKQESEKKLREALKIYQDLAIRFPDSKYAPEAYNRIAEFYFVRGGDADLERAIKNYSKVMDYPTAERFPEAVYKLAWTHYRLGNYPQAISYFTYLIDDVDSAKYYNNETQELDVEALVYIGISFNRWAEQIDLAQGTNEGGYRLIKSYIDEAKLNEKRYAPEIMWQLGESYNLEQKDTLALYAYKSLVQNYPQFWRAPDAQYKIVSTYDRLSRAVTDKAIAKTLLDSVLENRYKLYNAYKPNSDWSKAQEDKEIVAKGNRMARDVLVENIYYFYGEAQASNDLGDWKIAMDFSREFIKYFPVDTNAYFFHYNLAFIQYRFFGLLDSAYEDYVKVATLYPQDLYRYNAAMTAYTIADSLYRKAPYKKPVNAPADSIIPLSSGEENLIDAINSYARIFSDTVTQYPVDSLQNLKPVMGVPGKKTPDFLAYAGQIYYNHNNFGRSGQYFNTIVTRYPNSDKAQISQQYLMQTYYDRKDYRSSEIVAKRLLESTVSSKEQKEQATNVIFYSIYKRGEDFQTNKEPAKAAREFQRAYEEGTRIGYSKRDDRALSLFKSGIEYNNSKELKRSISAYEMYADSFPDLKDAPNALWNVQATYADLKEMKSAAKTAERLADTYPNYSVNKGAVTAEIALYNAEYYVEQAAKRANAQGDSTEGKAMNTEAIRISEKFVKRYPKSEYASTMDFGVANLYFLIGDEERAYQKYRQFAATFPNDKRNVQSLYDVGMNHLRKNRRTEATSAFRDALKKSDDLKKINLDFNKYFSSEAAYELARMRYEDFAKIHLKEPGVEHKEEMKISIVKELMTLYEAVTSYAQIRTYEATYYRGLVREEVGDALATKQFQQEKDLVKYIQAQKDAYSVASGAYRGAVEEYKNAYAFLDKAYEKFAADEKELRDSINALYPNSADSAQMVFKWTWEGKTAKEKEFSLQRQQQLAVQYRDLARSKISRILYAVANSKKLILDTYLSAPLPKEILPGTLDYISYQQQILVKAVFPAVNDAILAFETAVREMDSLGISDKYTSECRRNIVRFTGIVPGELAKLSFITMQLYTQNSDHYREVVAGGENYIDKKTGKDFYTIFYEIPLDMNTFISQFAKPIAEQAIKTYATAVKQAKEKNLFDEDARQIQREMFEFAYQFARLNYQEADTADKYYKGYEAEYFKNQSDEAFLYYSEASATYSQVLSFARENARSLLEEAFNSATTLELVKLKQDPNGLEGDNIAVTNDQGTKRILSLLGKYDQYYAKLLQLKSLTRTYASNYDDWLSNNKFFESWQTPAYSDLGWYNAAPPPNTEIAAHAILDTNFAYPLWIGLGQSVVKPPLPKYVPPIIVEPVDTSITETLADSAGIAPVITDSAAVVDSNETQSYIRGARLIGGTWVLQDTSVKPVYTQDMIKRQLDTAKIVYFRKSFNIAGNPQEGKMYIAADGEYDFYLNGVLIGSQQQENPDVKGDSLDLHYLLQENFVQGTNILAIVSKDLETPKEHYGIRLFLEVNEVEDITAQFADPPLPPNDQLRELLIRRARVVRSR